MPAPNTTAADPAAAEAAPPKLLLTQREAWTFLGLSRATWFRLRSANELPAAVIVAGALRWRRADLERYVANLRPVKKGFVLRVVPAKAE